MNKKKKKEKERKERILMKKVLSMILVLVLVLGMVGCTKTTTGETASGETKGITEEKYTKALLGSQAERWELIKEAAKETKKIVFYTYTYEDTFKKAADLFEKETGIKVEVIQAHHKDINAKLLAEKDSKKGTVDVIYGGGKYIKPGLDIGLFYGPIDAIIPEAKNMKIYEMTYAEGYPHYGYAIPYKSGPAAIMYDKRFVKNPPKSFEELEKWVKENPGKFCYGAKGGAGEAFVLSVIYWLTGGDLQYTEGYREELVGKWDVVWEWLNKIEPYIVYGNGNTDVLDKFSRGEVTLAAVWEDQALTWVNSGTLPKEVGFYLLEPGYIGKSGGFLSIPSNSPNKAASLLWINFLLKKDIVEIFVKEQSARIARKDVEMPAELKDFLITDKQLKELGRGFPVPEYKSVLKELFLEKVAAQ